jgi:uncharacterized protein (TIGR00251 family)
VSDGVELQASNDGVRLRLRVKPGARRQRLVGAHGGALKVEVTAPPERGRANQAVLRLLADTLDLPRQSLELTAGAGSQDKVVLVRGVSTRELRRLLRAAGVAV